MSRFNKPLEIQPRDIANGMRLILMPEHCPVTVVAHIGSEVSVMLPGQDVFTVPIASLRRIGNWRDAGMPHEVYVA